MDQQIIYFKACSEHLTGIIIVENMRKSFLELENCILEFTNENRPEYLSDVIIKFVPLKKIFKIYDESYYLEKLENDTFNIYYIQGKKVKFMNTIGNVNLCPDEEFQKTARKFNFD